MSHELALDEKGEQGNPLKETESFEVQKPNELKVLSPRYKLLDEIYTPHDMKKLEMEDLEKLAQEIRNFLILNLSRTGGHLAPNLGIVEITLALHKVFSFPRDELIFDVGHQAYVHKILTGRKDLFSTLRK